MLVGGALLVGAVLALTAWRPELNPFRALRTKTTTGQLCRGDIVSVFDATSGIEYGSCGLGDFVEYRK